METVYHAVVAKAPGALASQVLVLPDADVQPSSGCWPLEPGGSVVFRTANQLEWLSEQWGTFVFTLTPEQARAVDENR